MPNGIRSGAGDVCQAGPPWACRAECTHRPNPGDTPVKVRDAQNELTRRRVGSEANGRATYGPSQPAGGTDLGTYPCRLGTSAWVLIPYGRRNDLPE
jgi:hypothetical protein